MPTLAAHTKPSQQDGSSAPRLRSSPSVPSRLATAEMASTGAPTPVQASVCSIVKEAPVPAAAYSKPVDYPVSVYPHPSGSASSFREERHQLQMDNQARSGVEHRSSGRSGSFFQH
ncbi:uncharacterized protein LOC124668043 [Lolium rigidum]|uniref:uncharacterized protein LOC124668043 n=1 Tax=Lolium rigidum TaxID=89674 RepID=UPI001F5D81F3|nr:uncharacterized protein LOC124668043 [Lolium rigidum]